MSLAAELAERWPLPRWTEVRDELLSAWDRPGYHDLLHLSEVLDRLDVLAAHGAGFDRPVVELAAWFHDAVYAGACDDEEQSARWAERVLSPELTGEVARLVRMTARHRPDAVDANACALSDADLAILAAPRGRYDTYVSGVRADFAHASDEEFRAGRRAVLLELASAPHLFGTPQGRELWERAARANLARELAAL